MSNLTRTKVTATWQARAVGTDLKRRARHRRERHGLASLLAMLFLLLFATLAVGFYTASAMSSQISSNEQKLSLAQSAAATACRSNVQSLIKVFQ